jgi:hypothetical protein
MQLHLRAPYKIQENAISTHFETLVILNAFGIRYVWYCQKACKKCSSSMDAKVLSKKFLVLHATQITNNLFWVSKNFRC